MIPLALALFLGLVLTKVAASFYVHENWIRLQKTFVLAAGFGLYSAPLEGPALNTLYGPVTAAAYLPATLFRSPEVLMRAAASLSALYFFAPVTWIFMHRAHREGRMLFSAAALACFAFVTLLLPSMRNAAFGVHADAPAIGLAVLACGFLYHARLSHRWTNLFWAAGLAVLSLWTKQVAAPLLAAMALYLWISEGRRACFKFMMLFVVCFLAVSSICMLFFGTKELWFHLVVIPSRHPIWPTRNVSELIEVLGVLVRECLPAFFVAHFSIRPLLDRDLRSLGFGPFLKTHRWTLLILAGLFFVPVSVLGHLKVGGSRNALSYTSVFMTLGAVLAFLEHVPLNPPSADSSLRVSAAKVVSTLLIVLMGVHLPVLFVRTYSLTRQINFVQQVDGFLKSHPGEIYFPRFTLLHLLNEGKVYNDSTGLLDRQRAGQALARDEVQKYTPPHMRAIAFWEQSDDEMEPFRRVMPEFDHRTSDPRLPGFRIYAKYPVTKDGDRLR